MDQRLIIIFFSLLIHDAIGQLQHLIESASIGDEVAAWTPESGVNPEELQNDITRSSTYEDAGAYTWPQARIPYEIVGFTTSERAKIMEAIYDIHNGTCVRFVPRTVEQIYVSITSYNYGCYSAIGYTYARYNINLQSPACLYYKGTILHQLLHAIGLNHEQNRSDRAYFVQVNWDNINQTDERKFYQYHDSGYEGDYNYLSVMHFSKKAFSKNGLPTLQGVEGSENVTMGQRVGLTVGDIDSVNLRYGCYLIPNFIGYISQPKNLVSSQSDRSINTGVKTQLPGSYYVSRPATNLKRTVVNRNGTQSPNYRILSPIRRGTPIPGSQNSATNTYQAVSPNYGYSSSVPDQTQYPNNQNSAANTYGTQFPNYRILSPIPRRTPIPGSQNSATNTYQAVSPNYGYASNVPDQTQYPNNQNSAANTYGTQSPNYRILSPIPRRTPIPGSENLATNTYQAVFPNYGYGR